MQLHVGQQVDLIASYSDHYSNVCGSGLCLCCCRGVGGAGWSCISLFVWCPLEFLLLLSLAEFSVQLRRRIEVQALRGCKNGTSPETSHKEGSAFAIKAPHKGVQSLWSLRHFNPRAFTLMKP